MRTLSSWGPQQGADRAVKAGGLYTGIFFIKGKWYCVESMPTCPLLELFPHWVLSPPGLSSLSLFLSFSCKIFSVMDRHQLFLLVLQHSPASIMLSSYFSTKPLLLLLYSLSSSFITSSSHLLFVFLTSSERIPQVLLLPTLDLWGKTGQCTLRRAFYSVMVQSAPKTKAQRGEHSASVRQLRKETSFALS